jgi:hypothetical protein
MYFSENVELMTRGKQIFTDILKSLENIPVQGKKRKKKDVRSTVKKFPLELRLVVNVDVLQGTEGMLVGLKRT